MKMKIAKLLLGSTVLSILEKTEKYKNESVDYKTRLKSLLLKRNAINQQKADLEKRKHDIRIQVDTLKSDVEQKRELRFILDEIAQKEGEINNAKKKYDDCVSNIANLLTSIHQIQQETKDLKTNKTKFESDKKRCETGINEKDSIAKELNFINSDIINIQNWLKVHSTEITPFLDETKKRLKALVIDAKPEDTTVNGKQEKEVEEQNKEEDKYQIAQSKALEKKTEDGTDKNTAEVTKRKKRDRTIKEILDLETGETIDADIFFSKPMDELEKWRVIFQECISQNKRRFICPKCLEMIRISGQGDERGVPSVFTHKNDSFYCQRTTTGLSEDEINRRKYALVGQSQRHKIIKQQLCDCLNDTNSLALGVKNVETEKRVYSSLPFFNFRQPDVQVDFQDKHIVFEIQLSTTFLSVINERDTFYRLNGYYIIWVFNFEDNKKFVDLNNLAMKDIYFANKWNAFIFDEDARQWSRGQKQLVLKCNWLDPDLSWHHKNTKERFGGEPVTLDQLKFDKDTFKPYFFDAEELYLKTHPEMVNQYVYEQKSREDHIKELEQRAQDKETKRLETIELVKERGGCVIPFEEKKKIGFKYGATVIIEPSFTSCEKREDGSFIVGFNRKKGLVNLYGEMARKCEYINITPLSGSSYIAESKDFFWLSNMQEPFRERFAGDFVIREVMGERVEKVELHHKNNEEAFSIFYIIDGTKILAHIGTATIFIDLEGNKIVEEEFISMNFQTGEVIQVQRKQDGKWNNMDYDGEYVKEWSDSRPSVSIAHNLTLFYNGEHQGVLDSEGNEIVPPIYTKIIADTRIPYLILERRGKGHFGWSSQTSFFSIVCLDGTTKTIPDKFQIEFPFIKIIEDDLLLIGGTAVKLPSFQELAHNCDNVEKIENGFVCVKKENYIGLNDQSGRIIIPCEYTNYIIWNNDIYICKRESPYAIYSIKTSYDLINIRGDILLSGYTSIGNLVDGKAKVSKEGKEGEIDANGHAIFSDIKFFSCGLQGRIFLGYWEILDSKGDILLGLEKKISNAESLNNTKIIIEINGYKGVINTDGETIIVCRNMTIAQWTSNILVVSRKSVYKIIYRLFDETKQEFLQQEYDEIGELIDGKAIVKIGPFSGYIDDKGRPVPDKEIKLADGNIKYSIMGKWGIKTQEGKKVIDCSNDEITTYKGVYVTINKGEVIQTKIETANIIPIIGKKTGIREKSIVFTVAGKDFLVSKSLVQKTWKNNVPIIAELTIINICRLNPKYYGWKTKINVIAQPYKVKNKNAGNYRNTNIGEVLEGVIIWVHHGSPIVRLGDGNTIFVHKSNFKEMINTKFKGHKIVVKKIGFDGQHEKDIWEIIEFNSSGV